MSGKRKALNEFTSKDLGKEAIQIVTALALPEEMDMTVRFADQFACEKTAVSLPWQLLKINWSAVAAQAALPVTDMMIFIFRNPLCRIIYYYPNNPVKSYQYNWWFSSADVGAGAGGSTTSLSCIGNRKTFAVPLYALVNSGSAGQPHGTILYPVYDSGGECNNYTFLWCDAQGSSANGVLNWLFSTDPGAGTINVMKRVNGALVEVHQFSTTTSVLSYAWPISTGSGEYSFDVQTALTTSVTVNMQCTGGTIWAHLCDKDLYSNMYHVQAIRTIGCAFRFSNEASPMNKQGDIVCCQASNADDWSNFALLGYPKVASYPGSRETLAKNGADGFLKPLQQDDFKFLMPFSTSTVGNITESYLDENEVDFSFLVICASCTNTAGCDFVLRVSPLVEYKTSNTWIYQAVPSHTAADWIEALEIFKSLDQFYDNPVHFIEILKTIGKWASVASRWGKKIANVAAYLAK